MTPREFIRRNRLEIERYEACIAPDDAPIKRLIRRAFAAARRTKKSPAVIYDAGQEVGR